LTASISAATVPPRRDLEIVEEGDGGAHDAEWSPLVKAGSLRGGENPVSKRTEAAKAGRRHARQQADAKAQPLWNRKRTESMKKRKHQRRGKQWKRKYDVSVPQLCGRIAGDVEMWPKHVRRWRESPRPGKA